MATEHAAAGGNQSWTTINPLIEVNGDCPTAFCFQAPGTRGAKMGSGAQTVQIHGEEIAVKAEVKNLSMLSAHADADEIIDSGFQAPHTCFVTRGEPGPAAAPSGRIERTLDWACKVPTHLVRCTPIKISTSGSDAFNGPFRVAYSHNLAS